MCWCDPDIRAKCCGRIGCVPTWQNPAPTRRPTFVLKLQGEGAHHDIHSLRAILKRLLRTHKLKCIECREETPCADGSREIAASPSETP